MTITELNNEIVEQKLTPDKNGIGIERTFVEGYFCPKCSRNFVYRGFTKPNEETVCYGVCENCDQVKKFYFNSPFIAAVKRRFSKRENRAA